ncbi:MAG: HEAT repeat domain-containing protein [Myxococcota bacterium]
MYNQFLAIQALSQQGAQSASFLQQHLRQHRWWKIRYFSARALGKMKIIATKLQPDLRKGLHDPDRRVREAIVHALGALGEPSLKSLRYALRNDWWRVRALAIRYLSQLRPPHIVPDLERMFQDPTARVRELAVQHLGLFGQEGLPALIRALQQTRWKSIRWIAAMEIGRFYEGARPALPAMRSALRDKSIQVRLAVIEALGNIGPTSTPLSTSLSTHLKSKSARERIATAQSLGLIGPTISRKACERLARALFSKYKELHEACIHALGLLGKKSTPILRKALRSHPAQKIRQYAAKRLGYLPNITRITLQTLQRGLRDTSTEVQEACALSIGRIRHVKIKSIMQDALLRHKWWKVREIAAEYLGRNLHISSLRTLVKALEDTDTRVRVAVMSSISEYGNLTKPYFKKLRSLEEDADLSIREAAQMMNRKLNPQNKLPTSKKRSKKD